MRVYVLPPEPHPACAAICCHISPSPQATSIPPPKPPLITSESSRRRSWLLPTVGCHRLPLLPPPLPYPQEEEVDGLQRALDQAQRSLDAGRLREEETRQAGREGAERARRAEAMAQEHDADAQQVRGAGGGRVWMSRWRGGGRQAEYQV